MALACPRRVKLGIHRVALWAAYKLTADDVVTAQRLDAFRTDPRLTDDETAHCDD